MSGTSSGARKRAKPKVRTTPAIGEPVAAKATVIPMGRDGNGVIAYCPPPEEVFSSRPNLKHLGGSRSDHWNHALCNLIIRSGWFRENIPDAERQDQYTAILAFLASAKPADAIEGMMAAQLYASNAAAMECYRRAMVPSQSWEVKQTLLSLGAKLTKANATQVEALKKYRSKSEQKVVVEHVHVHSGGQAIVGQVTPGGSTKIMGLNLMLLDIQNAPRCGAKTRSGKPCQSPAMPNGRCRMHGGPSPGAPKGNQNAFKHGLYSAETIRKRREISALLRSMREASSGIWPSVETRR
jgi:hypothetical protein